MDPGLTLHPLGQRPIELTAQIAVLAGPFTPVHLPVPWLSAPLRAKWFLGRDDSPLSVQVAAALDAELPDEAWRLLANHLAPLTADTEVELLLTQWQGHELARLKLPPGSTVIVIGAENMQRAQQVTDDARGALADVREMLAALPWPRWIGPVVAIQGTAPFGGLGPERTLLIRPVLPLLRLAPLAAGETQREQLAQSLCRLSLTLTAPPAAGWPPWLAQGLEQVARAKARGEGPSPIKMLGLRQAAGQEAVQRLLRGGPVDQRLALAICAPLTHSLRRQLLPNLLDMLRHGVEPETALSIAYGITAQLLLEEK